MARLGFLDLPAEIQNSISELALQAPSAIVVHRIKDEQALTTSTPTCAALLRTCKKINVDATPVFYGNNKFAMLSTTILGFVRQIGKSIRHVRFLEFQFLKTCVGLKRIMRTLRAATGLECLKIAKIEPKGTTSAQHLAEALLPYVKSRSGRPVNGVHDQDEIIAAVDILELLILTERTGEHILALGDCIEAKEMEKEDVELYEAEVKGCLMGLLDRRLFELKWQAMEDDDGDVIREELVFQEGCCCS